MIEIYLSFFIFYFSKQYNRCKAKCETKPNIDDKFKNNKIVTQNEDHIEKKSVLGAFGVGRKHGKSLLIT